MRTGTLIRSSSLGYDVALDSGETIQAKRRRRGDIREGLPVIGDRVEVDEQGMVARILPRRKLLERPRVANLDQVAVTVSAAQPKLSLFLLDKYLTACLYADIPSFIIITKWDLLSPEEEKACWEALEPYSRLGYRVFITRGEDDDDIASLREMMAGKISAFMGQTGVGKSSLANLIDPSFDRPIGRYVPSKGRGVHQTKEVVLFRFAGGFLADTPGFSDFQLTLDREELAVDFPGYGDYWGKCRFRGCLHNGIVGCAVEEAVARGELSAVSHENYLKLFSECPDAGWSSERRGRGGKV